MLRKTKHFPLPASHMPIGKAKRDIPRATQYAAYNPSYVQNKTHYDIALTNTYPSPGIYDNHHEIVFGKFKPQRWWRRAALPGVVTFYHQGTKVQVGKFKNTQELEDIRRDFERRVRR